MSRPIGELLGIADRLREERIRLGESQAALAAKLGVSKKSQTNYELGNSAPAADYLAEAARAGLDVAYVLTGTHAQPIDPAEVELIARFRCASPAIKAAALAVLASSPDTPATAGVHVAGDQLGNVNTGTQTAHGPMTFNVGRQKKGQGE